MGILWKKEKNSVIFKIDILRNLSQKNLGVLRGAF